MTLDPVQVLVLILSSSVVGAVVVKVLDWVRDGIAGQMQKRRAEVDKAIAEKNAAKRAADWHERHANILEESLRVHRRQMIDAACIDPDDMPPYPTRPDREKS